MLARYSSDFVLFRELVQNSDDARATYVELHFKCDVSHGVINNAVCDNQSDLQHPRVKSKLTANYIGNAASHKTPSQSSYSMPKEADAQFHNSTIREICVINNGSVFSDVDWKRVASIAEGNVNVESIGQFGVGFFSVFSLSEEPVIVSGTDGMIFTWGDDGSLTARRCELPVQQQSPNTSIILKMRSKFILCVYDTKSVRESNVTTNIIPSINLGQLKSYLTKVLSFTKRVNRLSISINDETIFEVTKTIQTAPLSETISKFELESVNSMFILNSFEHIKQEIKISNGLSVVLRHIAVQAKVTINETLHGKIQEILKKSLPSSVPIQLLLAPSSIITKLKEFRLTSNHTNFDFKTLNNLSPLKFEKGQLVPSGYIFIGQGTHQTTGLGMHVYSHFIPTIERENIDLQGAYISKWNEELLLAVGQVARYTYDVAIRAAVTDIKNGLTICEGFFYSKADILVPVRLSPSNAYIQLIPSTKAYLTYSNLIYSFLSVPLIPIELASSGLFTNLKSWDLIVEVNDTIVKQTVQNSVMNFTEFVEFLRWLSQFDVENRELIREMLSLVKVYHNTSSDILTLKNIRYFDPYGVPSILPLRSDILPSSVVQYISREQLNKRLLLLAISLEELLEFYMHKDQRNIFLNSITAAALLAFISNHIGHVSKNCRKNIVNTLSNTACVPTTRGMKRPNESYIPPINKSSDEPCITLKISQGTRKSDNSDDYPVSRELLIELGCRGVHLPSLFNAESSSSSMSSVSSSNNNFRALVKRLMQERNKMTDTDRKLLQERTSLSSCPLIIGKYAPCELYFPSVATQLKRSDLPIIPWLDIASDSSEYAFLKAIGVQEAPSLDFLIDQIIMEHEEQNSPTTETYQIPVALKFVAENFIKHYSNQWNTTDIKQPFLPSYFAIKMTNRNGVNQENSVILSLPSNVYADPNPVGAILLPSVVQMFKIRFDIVMIGVQRRPTLPNAFNDMMKRKDELLVSVSLASKVFDYMSSLEGLSNTFIEKISIIPFIPFGNQSFRKPNEVFIRSDSTRRNIKSKDNSVDERGLIDYVDFGEGGNEFLLSIRVLSYPTPPILARLLMDRQDYFFEHYPRTEAEKLRTYTACLKKLAPHVEELLSDPISKRLYNTPWCLGYQKIQQRKDITRETFRIAIPREIYMNDNNQYVCYLMPLMIPDEPALTQLYEEFGSRWLSHCVKRISTHTGNPSTSDRCQTLRQLILSRLDMLFVNNRGEPIGNLDQGNVELIRTSLAVFEVRTIQCQFIFQRKTHKFDSSDVSTCALELNGCQVMLYVLATQSVFDYFDIADELARSKLSLPLEMLKRRGIPVDRLMKNPEYDQTVIAFNQGGSLFFNLRYFEQVFADKFKVLRSSASSNDELEEIFDFYFMVTCHELAHNLVSQRDTNFAQCLEQLAVAFMPSKQRSMEMLYSIR
ncbi:unnamed protein product [Rotaria magnacalcarata]|uniref:Sacsin/Nov domain-containing protein n=1 Tax=Rotaria magnacalcarata TaxID=392030 RepID=A0A8S2LQU6_9BILA|nr:unnamed protein product [Rotaria magnacalcarata]